MLRLCLSTWLVCQTQNFATLTTPTLKRVSLPKTNTPIYSNSRQVIPSCHCDLPVFGESLCSYHPCRSQKTWWCAQRVDHWEIAMRQARAEERVRYSCVALSPWATAAHDLHGPNPWPGTRPGTSATRTARFSFLCVLVLLLRAFVVVSVVCWRLLVLLLQEVWVCVFSSAPPLCSGVLHTSLMIFSNVAPQLLSHWFGTGGDWPVPWKVRFLKVVLDSLFLSHYFTFLLHTSNLSLSRSQLPFSLFLSLTLSLLLLS